MKTVAVKPLSSKVSSVEVAPLTSNLAIIKRDPEVLAAEKEAPGIRKAIDALVIRDQASSELATDLIASCARYRKGIEAMRKKFVDPLNAHVKFINSLFKKILEPVEAAEQAGRTKLNAYMRAEFERAQKEAQKRAEQYERKVEKAEARGIELPPEPEAVEYTSGAKTESAAASTRMVPKYSLTGKIEDVDPQYLALDESKVRSVLKAGVREIKGLKIWEEPEARIYT